MHLSQTKIIRSLLSSPVVAVAGWLFVHLTPEAHATTRTWDGGGANNFWNAATNWVGDVAPVAGDDLVFPLGGANVSTFNNFPAVTTFNSISISGASYVLDGASIALNAGINATNTTGQNSVFIPLTLNSNQTITTGNPGVNLYLYGNIDTNGKDLNFAGNGAAQVQSIISGAGGLIKTGSGSVLMYASNTFSGPVQINQGGLSIYHGNALGATNGNTTLATDTTLALANAITIPEPLVLSGTINSAGGGAKNWTGPITLAATNATIQASSGAPLTINAVISGSGGFTKTSPDVLTLNSNNTYTGTTTVSDGTLRINGAQPASPIVLSFGTLGGSGTVGTITSSGTSAKTVSPGGSPGILNTSNVTFNSSTTFAVELNGTTVGSGYDQLNVTGTVALSNAILSVTSSGLTLAGGENFIIINNDGTDAINGTFSGLPEGATVSAATNQLKITYVGGNGNDVVLYQGNPPAQLTAITALTNGVKQIQGLGLSNLTYTIQATTNLNPVIVWINLGTATANGSGVFSFTDTNVPSLPMRFYRALSP